MAATLVPMDSSRDSSEKILQAARTELACRLRKRFVEIERAILMRIRSLSEPINDGDPAYLDGLQRAIAEMLSYSIECVEKGDEWCVPIPLEAAEQARRAARRGFRLDTVLRRYVAGNKLLEEFIVAEADDVPRHLLRQLLREQGPQVDRLIESIAAEFNAELARTGRSAGERFAHRVLHLLSGAGIEEASDLAYDFDLWHIGMILIGGNAKGTVGLLAKRLGYRSLCVERDNETVWAWLGCVHRPPVAKLERSLVDHAPEVSAAIGEPRTGLEGWRLTHREAQIGLQVMLQKPRRFTRGSDVVLLAGVLRDDTLVRSLLDTYIGPLEECANSGRILRETLDAYFSAGGNAAAAAARLGVTRHTVQRRIRTVEQAIGQYLHTCQAELQVALKLKELNGFREGT